MSGASESAEVPRDAGALPRVVIAGGGVAAIEALLALHAMAPGLLDVHLVAPAAAFVYRPLSVGRPFGRSEEGELALADLVAHCAARHHRAGLAAVHPQERRVVLTDGAELAYDHLLIATGARGVPTIDGALAFGTEGSVEAFAAVLEDLVSARASSAVFVVPPDGGWPLAVYELALMTATALFEQGLTGRALALVTFEDAPLELFGPAAGHAVEQLLLDRAVDLHVDTQVAAVRPGEVELVGGRLLPADHVITLPRLSPDPMPGVPQDADGFIATDEHARVQGLDGVFAAGDITTYPVKQGGLAAQQADVAARQIAAAAGAPVHAEPFRPVLRGMLMTGEERVYLQSETAPDGFQVSLAEPQAMWWPPAKVSGEYLAPYLAEHAGVGMPRSTPDRGVHVNVRLPDPPAA